MWNATGHLTKESCYGLNSVDPTRISRLRGAAELELFAQLKPWTEWGTGTSVGDCIGAGVNGADSRRDLEAIKRLALAKTHFCVFLPARSCESQW